MKDVKVGMGRRGLRFMEEKGETGDYLLYANDSVLYGESEEDMKVMVSHFVKVYRRRGMKVNARKSKVMVLNGEEELE